MVKEKKAQVGETMTWIVATVVIVVILFISIFIVSPLGDSTKFKAERTSDLLATKSLVNYLLSEENGEIIYNNLNEGKKLNDVSRGKIEELYNEEYFMALLSVVSKEDYSVSASLPVVEEEQCAVDVFIKLNEKEDVGLCLLWEERK
jgi:hypothetical protein